MEEEGNYVKISEFTELRNFFFSDKLTKSGSEVGNGVKSIF